MTLAQLQAFSALAARGSFTVAAAQLGISQSGLSHAIRALEQEWGVALFSRNSGRIALTDIGSRLLPRAQAMLGIAETLRQEALDARGLRQGTLRIGSFGPTASIRLLPPILERFRHQFPGVALLIDEGPDRQVHQWLLDGRIDIGFVTLPDERFEAIPLLEDQMVAIVPEGHPLATKRKVTLADLCNEPFVLTEAGSADIVHRMFMIARLRPDIRYRTSQLLSTLDVVARGDGVTIIAEGALPAGFARVKVLPLEPRATRVVGLAVLNQNDASPAAKAFISIARDQRWTNPDEN